MHVALGKQKNKMGSRAVNHSALTGLRGVCAVTVAIKHQLEHFPKMAKYGTGNDAGSSVCVFFVLSGYILATVYKSSLPMNAENRKIFYVKRIARCLPLYYTSLLLAIYRIRCILTSSCLTWDVISIALTPLGLQTLASRFPLWLAVTWSLSDEFMAYALFPALEFVPHFDLVVAFVVCLVRPVVSLASMTANRFGEDLCVLPITRLWEFFLGYCVGRRETFSMGAYAGYVVQGCWLFHWFVTPLFPNTDVMKIINFFSESGTLSPFYVLLVASLANGCGLVAGFLSLTFMQYMGRISFALYLVHTIVTENLVSLLKDVISDSGLLLLCFVASIGAAHLMHVCIERKCQTAIVKRWAPIKSTDGQLCNI
jgi:peptidoglycan/LPS O-acetylase OafA/YrhL